MNIPNSKMRIFQVRWLAVVAITVLGMNERIFGIGPCTLKEMGLDGDSTISMLRGKAKRMIEEIDWKGRDYEGTSDV